MERSRNRRASMLAGIAACLLAMGLLVAGPLAGEAQASEGDLAAAQGDLAVQEDDELQAQAVTKYPIWVGGKQVTSKNAKNVLGAKKKTVTYNAKTNTLTLNGATINKAYVAKEGSSTWRYGIYSKQPRGLTIVLKGTNKVSVPGKATAGSYAIGSNTGTGDAANLTFKGSGSLQAKAGKAGLFSFGIVCQNLNIMGSAKLTVYGGAMVATSKKAADSASSAVGSYGVYAFGFLGLHDKAKLIAVGKTKALNRAPSYSQNYTPQVKAGASAKKLKVNKKNPASSVYTKYKYVSISKASKSSSSSASSSGKTPSQTKITSLKGGGGFATVQWKKISKKCTGYEVQISSNSSFNGYNRFSYYKGHVNTTSRTYNISPAGTYYFRVRSLNYVSDTKTYYGKWSPVKSVYVYSGTAAG